MSQEPAQPTQAPAPQSQEQTQEPAQQAVEEPALVVPEGTNLPIVLSTFLNSRSSQVGDTFYADTTYPIWIQQRLVIPRGSIVKGTVTKVIRPGKIKGKAQLAISFDNILLPNGITRDLVAIFQGIHGAGEEKIDRQTETVEMDSSKGADAGQIAGPTSQGAIIGAIAGEGKGALIGGAAGGAVGLASILLSRGKELVLEPGTQFDIVLKQPLRFVYGEVDFSNRDIDSASRVMPRRVPRGSNQSTGQRSPWQFPW
jgi:type IV secretion system protein VirB10